MTNIINIREFVSNEQKILSGRPNGERTRKQAKLDKIDKDNLKYKVIIDDNFSSLNSSFWLGMFGDSVRSLCLDKFHEKYTFECKDIFKEKIDTCINIILQKDNKC